MKNRSVFTALITAACLAATSVSPVMADGMKVVTLGADLTQEQKDLMLRYFKVDEDEAEILTITNEDEREHLSAYVPLEQIGTRTVSCAYVKPTSSGGIKVRTANLSWVTCNMIASTLSTSGVSNCEVVAACPFEVSGTGALTGIIMAYETASGEELDETKKEIATEELVVTGNLAEDVGQNDATNVINEAKMEIIDSGIQDANEIYNVVVNIAQQNGVDLDAEQLDRIVSLLEEIAQQNYDYESMKETLENVEDNLDGETSEEEEPPVEEPTEEPSAEEPTVEEPTEESPMEEPVEPEIEDNSILDGLDESILGDDVISGSTEEPVPQEETLPDEEEPLEGEQSEEDLFDLDDLSEEEREFFEKLKEFCAGEFENDETSEQYEKKLQGKAASVIFDEEDGKEAARQVLEAFLEALRDGKESFALFNSETRPTIDLISRSMFDVFELDGEDGEPDMTEGIWRNYSMDERLALYNDAMAFFEDLYGETADTETTEAEPEEPYGETEEPEDAPDDNKWNNGNVEIIVDPREEEVPEGQKWQWLGIAPEDLQTEEAETPEEETPEVQEDVPADGEVSEHAEEVAPDEGKQERTPAEEDAPEALEEESQDDIPADEAAEGEPEDELNTEDLSDEDKDLFEKARQFCLSEFAEDPESESEEEDPAAEVVLSAEDGEELTKKVLEAYLEILKDGGESYVPDEEDAYLEPRLNLMEDALRTIFEQEEDPDSEEEWIWENYTEEDRKALFEETLSFFEELYGESLDEDEIAVDGAIIPFDK